MCGIGAILRSDGGAIPDSWLDAIDARIAHRGPDGNGKFRDGSGLYKAPLVAIHRVVNDWYRSVLKETFNPGFQADHKKDPAMGKWEPILGTVAASNPEGHLFFLVANAVDDQYTNDHCRLVHGTHSRRLDKTIAD